MNEQETWKFFYEIFDASMPRLGPGDNASTKNALDILLSHRGPGRTEQRGNADGAVPLGILDIGCGNGAQTIQLAKHADCSILAVDNHQPYLDELARRAAAEDVSGKIRILNADMKNLELDGEKFDIIWSEGALFVMGFMDGLAACRAKLAPGGMLAATELAWLRPDPPDDCRQFFSNAYPAMAGVQESLASINALGYEILDHFTLPESAWWDLYYHSLENRLGLMRKKYAGDQDKMNMIETMLQKEIDMYGKYSDYYGYEFYLLRF